MTEGPASRVARAAGAAAAWFAAVIVLVLAAAPAATGHALVATSSPADGARLDAAPSEVVIDFTEPPDERLSSIDVLDASGASVAAGPAASVAGRPATMRVGLRDLPDGVYTATWRVISTVDGHLTAGVVVFGVGVAPGAGGGSSGPVVEPSTSPLGAAGRGILYAGLALLLGAAIVAAVVFPTAPRATLALLPAGWLTASAGLVLLAAGQRADAGVGTGELLGTSIGRGLVLRAIPLGVAGLGVALGAVPRRAPRTLGLFLAGAGAAGVVFEHVASGHAGAGGWIALKVGVQTVHVLAVAAWIGGLAALLAGLGGQPGHDKAVAARRYSAVAGVALGLVAVTGLVRAVEEVGSLPALTGTLYGRIVILKVALIALLGLLGAVNRYRHVPATAQEATADHGAVRVTVARSSVRALRRVGTAELLIAAVVLGVTGLLAASPPAKVAAASGGQRAAEQITAEGTDFAKTTKVDLSVSPGQPGVNQFSVTVSDPQSGDAVEAEGVRLRFSYPARPSIGESELQLEPAGTAGVFSGRGSNLSFGGRWRVIALVEQGLDSVEIQLSLTTRIPDRDVSVIEVPGQPTLYTVPIDAQRSVQVYLDPGTGRSDLHATFFEGGRELPLENVEIIVIPPDGDAFELPTRRFGSGHFIGTLPVRRGAWRFDMIATTADGASVSAQVIIEVNE